MSLLLTACLIGYRYSLLPPFSRLVQQRRYPHNTTESRIESTLRRKTTTTGKFIQCTTVGTKKLLGIFHTVTIHKLLQIAPKVLVHYITQVSLVCLKQVAQLFQGKRGIQKYLTYLKLVQYTFIYMAVHLTSVRFLSGKLFLPLPLGSLEKQSPLPLGNGSRFFTS